MSLVVEDLSFAYGRREVLRAISGTVAPGRVTALVGPNAAGKSTLLRAVVGSLRPASGCVRIDGEPAHRLAGRRLAGRVAYVAQRPAVAAAFTVRQVVELGRYALPASRARVDGALDELDLHDDAGRPFPELSVGQQQRVALARAVAQLEPAGHLLLDEPTSAMDLRHVRDAMRLLRSLAQRGATVLVAMHDLAAAAAVADDAWLLDGGRLAAAGPVGDVLTPRRLAGVFGVGFTWIDRPGGGGPPTLLAELS